MQYGTCSNAIRTMRTFIARVSSCKPDENKEVADYETFVLAKIENYVRTLVLRKVGYA